MNEVTQDVEGVHIAVAELLEEAFYNHLTRSAMAHADAESEFRMLGAGPMRTLSPGYYSWAGYLLTLEEMRDLNVPIHGLMSFEVAGLVQVRRARHEFNVAHPCCSCGNRLESRWVPECDGCGAKFRRAA